MTTQTLEFNAVSGLTITAKLFAPGSDTVVASASATERTNQKNRYSVAFTDLAPGYYLLDAFVGSDGGFANEKYLLYDLTRTYAPLAEQRGIITDAVIGDVVTTGTTQVIEFNATPGLSITAKLFARGSDTVIDSAVAVERTNHDGRYRATFGDLAAGTYLMTGFVGSVGGFANETYAIREASGTYYPIAESPGTVQPTLLSSAEKQVGTTLVVYIDSTKQIGPVAVVDLEGNAVDLETRDLTFAIAFKSRVLAYTSAVTAVGNTFTVDIPNGLTDEERSYWWSLRDANDSDEPLLFGELQVRYAAQTT